ncbi:hypothetical protein ACLB2K_007063 [Fragaria x ananassa]
MQSNTWTSVVFSSQLLKNRTKWIIGAGSQMSFWNLNSSSLRVLRKSSLDVDSINDDATVEDFCLHLGNWNLEFLRYVLPADVITFAKPVLYVASAKQVELWAIKEGLILLQTLKVSNVEVETDCLEAVAAISSKTQEGMLEAGLIDDIKEILKTFASVSIKHVLRLYNSVAHRLAASAYEIINNKRN